MSDQKLVPSKMEQSFLDRIADASLSLWHKIQAIWFRWADLNQHSAWFLPVIGVVIAVDAIIVVLPGDVILVLAVLSNPKAWKKIWLSGALGGIIGGFILYLLVSKLGASWVQEFNAKVGLEEAWQNSRDLFNKHGLLTVAFGSIIPGASWAPVVLAGLAKAPWHEVLLYLIIGRTTRYFIFCFGTREGWAIMHTIREKAREEKSRILAADEPKTKNSATDETPPSSPIQ